MLVHRSQAKPERRLNHAPAPRPFRRREDALQAQANESTPSRARPAAATKKMATLLPADRPPLRSHVEIPAALAQVSVQPRPASPPPRARPPARPPAPERWLPPVHSDQPRSRTL